MEITEVAKIPIHGAKSEISKIESFLEKENLRCVTFVSPFRVKISCAEGKIFFEKKNQNKKFLFTFPRDYS